MSFVASVFGLVFAGFSNLGMPHLVFTVNAVSPQSTYQAKEVIANIRIGRRIIRIHLFALLQLSS